jgi:apolipoprotein D and lipocalin family protein
MLCALIGTGGCSVKSRDRLPTVEKVDLQRFVGDWYLIGVIPTRWEKGAHNAVESYSLAPDGSIPTTFTFRKGGFDGQVETIRSRAFVRDQRSNAEWRVQFFWPLRFEYLIVDLDEGYTRTMIARNKRDHAWIMSRTPTMPEAEYERMSRRLAAWGYDTTKLVRVPQRW